MELTIMVVLSVVNTGLVLYLAFWKSYATKTGEIKAMQDNLEQLVDQTKELTKAAEDIRDEISTGAWQRQLRKEAAFEIMKAVGAFTLILTKIETQLRDPASITERHAELITQYHAASWNLEVAIMQAHIVCGKEVAAAVDRDLMGIVRDMTKDVMEKRLDNIPADFISFQKMVRRIAGMMPTDLGINT